MLQTTNAHINAYTQTYASNSFHARLTILPPDDVFDKMLEKMAGACVCHTHSLCNLIVTCISCAETSLHKLTHICTHSLALVRAHQHTLNINSLPDQVLSEVGASVKGQGNFFIQEIYIIFVCELFSWSVKIFCEEKGRLQFRCKELDKGGYSRVYQSYRRAP